MGQETPWLYNRLASDNRIDFWHCEPNWIQANFVYCIHVDKRVDIVNNFSSFENMLSRCQTQNINDFDLVFDRVYKPLPAKFMEILMLIETKFNKLKFVNSPKGIHTHLSPYFLSSIASKYLPPTIVTKSTFVANRFLKENGTIVAKEPETCGGNGVHLIEDKKSITDIMSLGKYIELQKYVENKSEKRISVVNGKIVGTIMEEADSGWKHKCEPSKKYVTGVSEFERNAIKETEPMYKRMGVHTLGYDFLWWFTHRV